MVEESKKEAGMEGGKGGEEGRGEERAWGMLL